MQGRKIFRKSWTKADISLIIRFVSAMPIAKHLVLAKNMQISTLTKDGHTYAKTAIPPIIPCRISKDTAQEINFIPKNRPIISLTNI